MISGFGICIVEGCSGVLFWGIDVFVFDWVLYGKCLKVLFLWSSEFVLEVCCSFGGEKFVMLKLYFGYFLEMFGFLLCFFGGELYEMFLIECLRNFFLFFCLV